MGVRGLRKAAAVFMGSSFGEINRNGLIRHLSRLYQTIGHSPNIFAPASAPAHNIFRLSMFVLTITMCVFLIVSGLLFYVLLRFRQRVGDNGREPAQVYGSNQIEAVALFNFAHLLCEQRVIPKTVPRVMAARQSGLVARRANSPADSSQIQSNDALVSKFHT